MIKLNAPEAGPLQYGTARAIFAHLGLSPETCTDDVAQSLRLFFPLDSELATRVRTGATSLTDSATAEEQIRYFQQRRSNRSYISIGDHLMRHSPGIAVHVGRQGDVDASSHDFLNTVASSCGWRVTFQTEPITSTAAETTSPWSPAESRILSALQEDLRDVNIDDIVTAAFEYVGVGDARTAEAIGRRILEVEQSPRVWNLLALASTMQSKSEQAEVFYKRWAESNNKLDQVRALYGLAMLQARHHQAGMRSISKSGELLDAAYKIIQSLGSESRANESVVFEEVFNRNGAALVHFRNGAVEEALRLMRWGIARLTQTTEKVAIHRSVLMYNLAQCHRQMGNIQEAIAAYEALLEVDPYMPEYHLEAAKCYAGTGNLTQAIASCQAAISLDSTLPTAWSLRGVYMNRNSQHLEAATSFREAGRLAPQKDRHALDEAYSLILAGDIPQALGILSGISPTHHSDVERWGSLLAECHIKNGNFSEARDALHRALKLTPESAVLKSNLDHVSANAAN